METLADGPTILDSSCNCGFSISTSVQKSKAIEFFDELYVYPPKFKIKWETIGEFKDEPFMAYTYRTLSNTFPLFDSITNLFFSQTEQYSKKNSYSANSYLQGFSNRLTTNQFYDQKTTAFQKVLKKVPVYTILNEQGEIVLADSLNANYSFEPNLNKITYNLCGKFDPIIDQTTKLGLFFMSKKDATLYLKEIVSKDSEGVNAYGLSLHCVGLDFAYRVMREYTPNIDFRFIPDLNEVQTLLLRQNKIDSNLSFSAEQNLIQFKRLPSLLLGLVYKLSPIEISGHSFFNKLDYFKGVPIYIVKTQSKTKNFFLSVLFTPFSYLERISALISQGGKIMGIGNNLTYNSQDNILSIKNKEKTKLYIFFERDAAFNFCQNSGMTVIRHSGNGSKILVSNLEDFLELLEEDMVKNKFFETSFNQKRAVPDEIIEMVASNNSIMDMVNQPRDKRRLSNKSIKSFFLYKYQRFQAFLELLLNFN